MANRDGKAEVIRDIAFVIISIATIAITIFLLVHAGLTKLIYEIPIHPIYLILAEVIYIIQFLLIGLRLSIIFNRGMGYKVSVVELFQLAMAQTFASLIMPGFYIGGEAISITYLTQRGLPTTRATEGILMRYTLDTIVVSMVAIILSFMYYGMYSITLIVAFILLIAYLVLLVSIMSARLGLVIEKSIRRFVNRFKILEKYVNLTENDIYGIKFEIKDLIILLALTLIQWFFSGVTVMLVFDALGVSISIIEGLFITVSYVVLTYVSILPGSAGIGELANLYVLSILGLSDYFVAYDVWFRVVTYITPLIILLPHFLRFTRKITRMVQY